MQHNMNKDVAINKATKWLIRRMVLIAFFIFCFISGIVLIKNSIKNSHESSICLVIQSICKVTIMCESLNPEPSGGMKANEYL